MHPTYVIEARNLTKAYGTMRVLKGIDLRVERGTMVALLGPNGAGKTTTVRILSTSLRFDTGTVLVDGHDVRTEPDKVRAVIGLTGQTATVDELLTGRENLVMMGRLYRLTATSARVRAHELLAQFDLVEAADRPAKTYSGGMRRRLDLAASLIATPPVLFLDEPTTGLHPRARLSMWDIIKNLLAGGTTILLTTQYLEEADQLADRIVFIDNGQVIAEGTPSALKSKVGNDRLELTFGDDDSFRRALAALGDYVIGCDTRERSATVMIKDTNSDVKRALDVLAEAHIDIQSLAVHKPTLDDAFLSLTGKQEGLNVVVTTSLMTEHGGTTYAPAAAARSQSPAPLEFGRRPAVVLAVNDSLIMVRRSSTHIIRNLDQLLGAFLQPIMFLLLFATVFGGAIARALPPGINYLDFLMPGIIVQTVAFGSTTTAVAICNDLQKGIMDRFRSLPMSSLAVLNGHIAADILRNTMSTLVMLVVGCVIGSCQRRACTRY